MNRPVSSPNLWVVIPTYNRSEDLAECLASLLKAGITQEQIIIVDNNSQDDTVEMIARAYPQMKLFALEENAGASGASNMGFKFALEQNAEWVLRLDSDTVVAPDFIDPLLANAAEDAHIGVTAPKIYYFDPPDEIWYAGADTHPWHFGTVNGHRHAKDAPENNQVREVDYAWGAAMLIRGEVLRKTDGFDRDFFIYYEEVDFCQRFQKLGYKLIFVPQSHVWHKVGSSANNAWTAYHWNRSKMLFYRKHARNTLHLISLIAYTIAYALTDAMLRALSIRQKSGNRGPLKNAIKGLWDGMRHPLTNTGHKS